MLRGIGWGHRDPRREDIHLRDPLAILGGRPSFGTPRHVGQPNVGDEERLIARLREMLARGRLSNHGPFVREFEQRIVELTGARHAVAVANGTLGLDVLARALGLSGEVIVPAFTFVATAHAFRWAGLRPVFADMKRDDHNVDPGSVAARVTPRTSAIVATHVWGRPCDVVQLSEIAARHRLPLLLDAAHAFGCDHRGTMIGNFGTAEVFSFHATKFVNCFEGGAICTHDDALAKRLRLMINFGFEGYDHVVSVGTNAKMNEASAAMGLTSLEAMETTIACNRRNHGAYARGFAALPGTRLLGFDPSARNNYQYVVAELDPARFPLTRDELVAVLRAEGVLARKYFWPGVHRMAPYANEDPDAAAHLPVVESLAGNILVLPTGTAMTEADVATVCELIHRAANDATAIRLRCAS